MRLPRDRRVVGAIAAALIALIAVAVWFSVQEKARQRAELRALVVQSTALLDATLREPAAAAHLQRAEANLAALHGLRATCHPAFADAAEHYLVGWIHAATELKKRVDGDRHDLARVLGALAELLDSLPETHQRLAPHVEPSALLADRMRLAARASIGAELQALGR